MLQGCMGTPPRKVEDLFACGPLEPVGRLVPICSRADQPVVAIAPVLDVAGAPLKYRLPER